MIPKTQDEKRREQAVEEIIKRCAAVKCQICGKTDWKNGELSILAAVDVAYGVGGGNILLSSPINVRVEDTVIPVQCGCGHILLFKAVAVGAEPRGVWSLLHRGLCGNRMVFFAVGPLTCFLGAAAGANQRHRQLASA